VKPAPFAYHRAHSVDEAVALLAELGDEAKILAGGLSLVPMMNFRLARPAFLVDVSRIGGLSYLRAGPADGQATGAADSQVTGAADVPETALRVGALTTHRAVETTRDPAVLKNFGVLPRSARWIGHYPIRSRGTFGGSIAHADPASEWCLLAILLDARIVLTGPAGPRTVPAAEFFEGYYSTTAGPDEMITELRFPEPAPAAALTEFAQRQGDFAVVAAAVSADIADGTCRAGRVVLGGVGPRPLEIDAGPLAGQPATAETWQAMGEHAAARIDPPDDTHGDAAFRRRLTVTLVARALAEASRQVPR
jgi:aerobic carbon-monoxide dehydrogenase medium subunit